MKKLIAVSFVVVLVLFLYNFSIFSRAQSEGGSISPEEGGTIVVGLLEDSIIRDLDALRYASRSLPPEKCAIRLDETIFQKELVKLEKLNDNLCDNETPTASRLIFDPRFEQKTCVVGTPNFFMCICPHRPNYPGCKEYLSDSDKPKCFEKESFEPTFNFLANNLEKLATNALVDSNMNGKPDVCENNGKLPGEDEED